MFKWLLVFIEKNKFPCLRRLTKEYDGVDAWRIQKNHKGITFRICLADSKTGGKEEGKKKALAILHIINSLLSIKSLSMSFEGQKKNPKESTREGGFVPRDLIDEYELRKILKLSRG